MPYHSPSAESWTGFYTSRPFLKLKLRNLTQELNTSRFLYGLGALRSGDPSMVALAKQFTENAAFMVSRVKGEMTNSVSDSIMESVRQVI